MKRRLYFLLPDVAHAGRIVVDFEEAGVPRKHIHVIGRGIASIHGLQAIPMTEDIDRACWVEWWWWRINLSILFIALFALVASVLLSTPYMAFVAVAVIATTFVLGAIFATRMPNVQLGEFQSAITHGEILVMTDMHRNRIAGIEDFVRTRHQEATPGGVCWMTATF